MKSGRFSKNSGFRSFKFAFVGIWSMLKNEPNSRIHFIAAVTAIAMGFVFNISLSEWIMIIIVIGMVFLAELFNSSIETIADIVDPDWNPNIKKVKDYAAGAVLIAAIISTMVGGLIFIPKIRVLI